MPAFNSNGNETKSASDGMTNQKIPVDKSVIFSTLFVSIYSHIMANTDTRGTEARTAPINELRLDISEIITTSNVVITILIM